MNYKALDEIDFKKLVSENGYKINNTTNHYEIVDKNDNRLMVFAVSHKKGSKRFVKRCYVKEFMKKFGEL